MNPHLAGAQAAVVHAGSPLADSRAVTVLMHGRAQRPEYMLAIAGRLDLPGMAYVAISAANDSWYPKSFLAPQAENQPLLDFALERLDVVVRDLEAAGKPRARIALLGFSQGACVLSEYVRRRGGRWGALVAYTGGVIGPPGMAMTCAPLAGTPVVLATADPDEWVPPGRVRETAELMARAGAAVELRVLANIGHVVNDEEIALGRQALERLLTD